MRVVSHIFLRKGALGYIFNSKVANVQTHIKYRNKFLEALRNPASFDHIKDYWVIGCVIGWWSGWVVEVWGKGFWGWKLGMVWGWGWVGMLCYMWDGWLLHHRSGHAVWFVSDSAYCCNAVVCWLLMRLSFVLSSWIFTLIRHKYLITNNRLHQYPSLRLQSKPNNPQR